MSQPSNVLFNDDGYLKDTTVEYKEGQRLYMNQFFYFTVTPIVQEGIENEKYHTLARWEDNQFYDCRITAKKMIKGELFYDIRFIADDDVEMINVRGRDIMFFLK